MPNDLEKNNDSSLANGSNIENSPALFQRLGNLFKRKQLSSTSEEKLFQLKEELLKEIKKEDELKKEIVTSLKGKVFFQHPAVLLILGFLLTTGVGSGLTFLWQTLDKQKQDTQLKKQNKIKTKNDISDEAFKLVLQTHSATNDLLYLYQYNEMPDIREKILLERLDYWQKASREWREKSPFLDFKIKEQFQDTSIHGLFDEVVNRRSKLGTQMGTLRYEISKNGWAIIDKDCPVKEDCMAIDCDKLDANSHFQRKVRCTLLANVEMYENTLSMIKKMRADINVDENSN